LWDRVGTVLGLSNFSVVAEDFRIEVEGRRSEWKEFLTRVVRSFTFSHPKLAFTVDKKTVDWTGERAAFQIYLFLVFSSKLTL